MHIALSSIFASLLILPLIYGSISIFSILKRLSNKVWIDIINDGGVNNLPTIAILLPFYHETLHDMLLTIKSIVRQDYPKDKIEVFIVLEHDDKATFKHVNMIRELLIRHGVRPRVVINDSPRSSKAYALNKALKSIPKNCEAVVVYDAGDVVLDNQHLRKVVRLIKEGADVIGVKVYRVGENIIGKLSFLDTLLWYDVALPGLFKVVGYPLLSGEGLAISSSFLMRIGGFPDKLTEDSYLTIHLALLGGKARLLNVTIYEGAPQSLKSLIKQRIRWYRGYFECLIDVLLRYSRRLRLIDTLKLILIYSEPLALLSTTISLTLLIASSFMSIHPFLFVLALLSFSLVAMAPLYLILDLKMRSKVVLLAPFYWFFQGLIALLALIPIHMPWFRTVRAQLTRGYSDTVPRLRSF